MTRQQQNDLIISKLGETLTDLPNVQDRISKAFSAWFRNLVASAAPPPTEEGGGEGAEAAPPEEGAEG
jgi:hypothetical protein